ncbi:MAG: sulfotransferase family protein [Candidatus Hermodarchaeota archaeon]
MKNTILQRCIFKVYIVGKTKGEDILMQLIGAAFGRTGTTSLKAALEELGLKPCYHAKTLFTHPSHAKIWLNAAQKNQINWQQTFKQYKAALDFPAFIYYQELIAAFPDAKVLLTVRDFKSWYESTHQTIYAVSKVVSSIPRWLTELISPLRNMIKLTATMWDGLFQGRFEDQDYAISIFKQYIENVKAAVPPENLLVFNVQEGWEPLCNFLNVPIPNKPFPHLNDRNSFQKFFRILEWSNRWIPNPVAGLLVVGIIGVIILVWLLQTGV